MTGRVVIVTGASCGLGLEVARQLCDGGNDVILAAHDEEQTKAAVEKIKQNNPGALATSMQLDVSSLESVHKFVDAFHESGKKLNVLVNCAGVKLTARQRQYSVDNFELTMAINHLGHFLLTNLLLADLKNAVANGADARVVVVTSRLHDVKSGKLCKNLQALDTDNLFLFNEGSYTALQAYKNSRTANIMFTYELTRHVKDSGIKVCAVCPNFEPPAELTTPGNNGHNRSFTDIFMRCLSTPETAERGAAAICAYITEEKFKDVTGKYLKDGEEVASSEETLNEELQSKLWELSARYVRLDGYEPLEVSRPAPEPEPEQKKEKKSKKSKTKNENNEEVKPAEENVVIGNGHGMENGKENGKETVEETKAEEKCNGEESKEIEKVNGTEEIMEEKPKLVNGDSKVESPVSEPCKPVVVIEEVVDAKPESSEEVEVEVDVKVDNGIVNGN